MKRIIIAGAILASLCAASLAHSFYVAALTEDLISYLAAAEAKAEASDWYSAQSLTQSAWDKWSAKDAYLHIFLRHDETDGVHTSFCEVTEYLQCQESGEYSAANARLMAQLALLSEGEQPTLKNIL